MRISTRSQIASLVGSLVICLSAAFLLSSCKKTPEQKLLGKWDVKENGTVVDYRKDGTVTTTQNGKSTASKYRFVDANHLEMEIAIGVGTNTTVLHLDCQVTVDGNNAVLVATIPNPVSGAASISQTLHYTRAK